MHSFLKFTSIAILIAGGTLGGLYLSGSWPGHSTEPIQQPKPEAVAAEPLQRFALSTFDVRDPIEAPELASDAFGRVYLAWSSQTSEKERALYLSRFNEETSAFDPPATVARTGIVKFVSQMKGKTISRESRMLPQLAINGSTVHLAWVGALPDMAGVRMVKAISDDNGASFDTPECVHQGTSARPTFTDLAVGLDGTIVASWLDNREKSQQPFAAIRVPGPASFAAEESIHPGEDGKGTCPCCPTASLVAPDGTVYVAFRNLSDGYRDIAIGRKKPGQTGFEGPFPVTAPTWKFDGCPHDGPSMVIAGERLHIVWMDARSGSPRCYHGQAKLADLKFTSKELHGLPVGSQGNAKIFADQDGGLHAVWEESQEASTGEHRHGPPQLGAGGGRVIMYAFAKSCCRFFGEARAIAPKPGVFQTRPTITGTIDDEIFVAWNELDESGKAIVVKKWKPDNKGEH